MKPGWKDIAIIVLAVAVGWLGRDVLSIGEAEAEELQQMQPTQQSQSSGPIPPGPSNRFSECFAATTWAVSGRGLNNGEEPRSMVQVPTGWTVVGGGARGTASEGMIILCR